MKKLNKLQKELFKVLYREISIYNISVMVNNDNILRIRYIEKSTTCWEYYIYPNGTIEKY